jgi:hypothetical protein
LTRSVTDDQVAALRAYLTARDDAEADDAEARFLTLAKSNQLDEIGALVYCTFAAAVRRQFSPTWTSADLVRFVADVRASSPRAATMISAPAAENQLRGALGKELTWRPDEETRARVQLLLLTALAADLTGSELDTVLADGRTLSNHLRFPRVLTDSRETAAHEDVYLWPLAHSSGGSTCQG